MNGNTVQKSGNEDITYDEIQRTEEQEQEQLFIATAILSDISFISSIF